MSPSAILPETTHELTANGVSHAIAKSAALVKAGGAANGVHPAAPPGPAPLDASRTVVTLTSNARAVPAPDSPEVWDTSVCTDHMVTVEWNERSGWAAPALRPHGPLSLMPSASCLHYATECFEGMKAYRGYDGKVRIFRPDRNCARMLLSATRVALPAFPPAELQRLVERLLAVDAPKWLPRSRPGSFLYLRPTLIGTGGALGVRTPADAMLFILATCFPSFDEPPPAVARPPSLSPPDPAAARAQKPGMKLLASREDTVRAWAGGFGHAKLGANYGPTLVAQAEAKSLGYDQVLWLLGNDRLVTEAGASNFFVVWRAPGSDAVQLVTAPLDDKIILDGVTRRSVLELARTRLSRFRSESEARGAATLEPLEVVERRFTMAEVERAVEEGRLIEAFACGTAFFIAAVSEIHSRGTDLAIPMADGGTSGRYAAVLKTWLKDVMFGREAHEWGVVVPEGGAESRG
ncbi:MAG: hypothetical protein M1832_005598 [Thelocarpon impressellum]|nr:MAG: hypothetical protein M1832_005598 [Thelocarpon impressellum]